MSEPPANSRTGPVLVGAIDQGTQSTRFFLFDKECSVVASAQAELPQHYPKPGWSEHDPLEIWASTQQVIEQACEHARAAVGAFTVAAIGITNQRETTVAWSRETGRPLHNAIVWHDNRTQHICHEMERELGSRDYFRPVTGLPISTYFSAFKARWLRENVPAVAEALRSGDAMLGTVDSWLIYCLTGAVNGGVHVTDVTNASRTNLMDVRTRRWHRPFLELFGLPLEAMPSIISNAEECGKVAAGPLQGVSISGSLGDQQAALLGDAKNTYGTGCFMLLHTGEVAVDSHHGLLTTLAFQLGRDAPAEYALEGSVAVAGMAVSWLRDSLGILSSAAESEDLARRVENTGGVYFVPAFAGLLAPHWRDDARGVIVGLSGFTNNCHIARAVLEAICFQTREVLDAMRADASESGCQLAVLRVDGGATANGLLMQLQADLLQAPVVRPAFQETTGLGAALAAGLACGFWTWEQIFSPSQRPANDTTFCPAVPETQAERRYSCWKTAVQRSLDLADLADNGC